MPHTALIQKTKLMVVIEKYAIPTGHNSQGIVTEKKRKCVLDNGLQCTCGGKSIL